jgi:HprK-related kinase A
MSRISDLTFSEFSTQISGTGIGFKVGPFQSRIKCNLEQLHAPLYTFYGDYPVVDAENVFSFCIDMRPGRSLTRPFRRLVRLTVDGIQPHDLMPLGHALPVREWGINLVIAVRAQCYLMLHSAVVERNGSATLLPAAPGSGKSTLCAGLSSRGWRTLSDEFGLIRPDTCLMIPVPRPIALKDESIRIIREFAPEAFIGPVAGGTRKGDVAHLKPSTDSIERQSEVVPASRIIFPLWKQDTSFSLRPIQPAEAFMLLATNAFNYDLLGAPAFRTVRDLVATTDCYRLTYSDLDEATERLSRLADENAP